MVVAATAGYREARDEGVAEMEETLKKQVGREGGATKAARGRRGEARGHEEEDRPLRLLTGQGPDGLTMVLVHCLIVHMF